MEIIIFILIIIIFLKVKSYILRRKKTYFRVYYLLIFHLKNLFRIQIENKFMKNNLKYI